MVKNLASTHTTHFLHFAVMVQPLALELYHLIVRHIDDTTDLQALALCCSAFRDEAQRCLFRHVDLKLASQHRQQQLFISTVNSAPLRFGLLVHTLHINLTQWDDYEYAMSLSTALCAMCSLKHLELHYGRPSPILRGCNFSLHSFSIIYGTLWRDELVFLLCDFLPTQHHIRHLEFLLSRDIYDVNAPAGLCPQLDSLGLNGDSLVDTFLSESRLISHFQWHGFPAAPPLTTHQLGYLKSLRFLARIDTTFTRHLTSLVYLELVLPIDNVNRFVNNVSPCRWL